MKPHISSFLAILLFFSLNLYAQVGIGTTNPDPSSAIDISSTESGMLVPRMETLDREAISSPATGLLVYDTDFNLFYFYNGTDWVPLDTGAAEQRDNYKLVKDIADLADELSGGTYVLNTDYLYEINGVITVDAPIDLNGAYVEGVDVGEDVLVNATGGALFTGSTAGSIRNISINGNGNQIFDLTGGSLVVNNTLFSGASAIGSLSGMGLTFFSITQFVNNGDGITVAGTTGSYFMSNSFWTDTNTGTYLDFDGTFDNLQLANGRVVANAGETGVDVSDNPVINNSALMSGLSFVGGGTLVEPYTAGTYDDYNFSVDWDVNCEGIPLEADEAATGDLSLNFYSGTGASTNPTGNGVPLKIAGTTESFNLFRFSSPQTNRLVYEGSKTRYFTVSASISFVGSTNNDVFFFFVAKGDAGDPTATPILTTATAREIGGNNDIGAVPVVATVQLSPGDYIEMWVERDSGSGTIFTASLNVVVQ